MCYQRTILVICHNLISICIISHVSLKCTVNPLYAKVQSKCNTPEGVTSSGFTMKQPNVSKICHPGHTFHHLVATSSNSCQVVSFSLGLFFRLPLLFSSLSIFSQPPNGTILTFLLSNSWRRPSLPGFDKLELDVTNPLSTSSDMLATCYVLISNANYNILDLTQLAL